MAKILGGILATFSTLRKSSIDSAMNSEVSLISRDLLTRIVEAATLAPSAENLQPWQFRLDGESLLVSLDLSRQLSSDVGCMLGLTGIGAAIENAVLAASVENLQTDVDVLSKHGQVESNNGLQPVARMRFLDGGQADRLAEFLTARCTSRRMKDRLVDLPILAELSKSIRGANGVQLHWVDEQQLPEFAALVGRGNRIRFEHQPFHAELYHSLRFTADEVERTRDGLDMATLQLPLGIARIMHFLRKWPRMKVANAVGFSHGVARQATAEVLHSGAVGFLTVDRDEIEHFIFGGRALERLWLTATQLGLRFHPTASLPVFLAHARIGGEQLSKHHRAMTERMSERFYRLFPSVEGSVVQMAFRVGYGEPPPVRSLRRASSSVVEFS